MLEGTLSDLVGAADPGPVCEFCGKPLKRIRLDVSPPISEGAKWVTCYGSCGCEESRRKLESFEPERAEAEPKGVPKRLRANGEPDRELVEAVLDGRGAWIYGDTNGAGKSALAAAVADECAGSGYASLWAYVPDALRKMASAFSDEANELYYRLCSAKLLVLDDLGKESPTEGNGQLLAMVAEARYNAELPTIVTSNFDGEGLISRYGGSSQAASVVSRLFAPAARRRLEGDDKRWR